MLREDDDERQKQLVGGGGTEWKFHARVGRVKSPVAKYCRRYTWTWLMAGDFKDLERAWKQSKDTLVIQHNLISILTG